MNDVATLVQIVVSMLAVTAPVILIVLVIAGRLRVSIFDLSVPPAPLPWPKGVQEEDCPRWDIDRLGSRTARSESLVERCSKPAEPALGRRSRSANPSRAS